MSRTVVRESIKRSVLLSLVVCILCVLVTVAQSQADNRQNQINGKHHPETAAPTDENAEPSDPLGRGTPYDTVFHFLQAGQTGKYKDAAKYLQLSKSERALKGEQLARQLHELMDKSFIGRVGAISTQREGSAQEGVPTDHERIGVFRLNGMETNVDLVRVSDPTTGEIWLFSSQLLAAVPDLFDQIETSEVEEKLPDFLENRQILSTPLWRLVALVLLIPVSLGLAWGIVHTIRWVQRLWLRWRQHTFVADIHHSLAGPATLILTVIFHQLGVYWLGVPLLIRVYYHRLTGMILVAGVTWLLLRLINRWGERARLRALAGSGYRSGSIMLLGQRILSVFVGIVALLVMLSILGLDITAAIAGLGVGSIAIAFAAQKTLENLLGGISIIGDQVIRVGEVCRIGGQVGTVEDISLRSTRIRTLDGTELSVPNGQLANMNVENLSRRETSLFRTTIRLRCDTSLDRLRALLGSLLALLRRNPKVDADFARVRLIGFGESSFDVEVNCHIRTGDLEEFLAIREQLLLRITESVTNAGVEFAFPSRTIYLTEDRQVDIPRKPEEMRSTPRRSA